MSRVARLSNHDPSTRCRVPRPKYPHIHRASLIGTLEYDAFRHRPSGDAWTLAFGRHEDRTPTHGYAATREAAMAAFAKSWRRE
jgi:hypothetical protein